MLEHLIDRVQRDSVVAASDGRQVERQLDLPVLSGKADAVVRDHKLQRPVFGAADGDPDSPRPLLWLDAVSDRVFHQHLKRELRNKAGKQRLVRDGHLIGYFIAEAHLLQFYIKFRVLQLLRQLESRACVNPAKLLAIFWMSVFPSICAMSAMLHRTLYMKCGLT